jgi:2-haloacid dehalogenase
VKNTNKLESIAKNKIKNIIFDFGGVLIQWDPDLIYDNYFKSSELKNHFYKETNIFEINKLMDKGLPFTDGLLSLVKKFPHYEEAIWHWKNRWVNMIGGDIEGSVAILKELYQRKYNLYGLTNWSYETLPYILSKYDFFSYFIDIVISGKEKYAKPEIQIYQILINRNNLTIDSCLFIDDNIHNIEAARSLGIKSILFVDPLQLESELNKLNLLGYKKNKE